MTHFYRNTSHNEMPILILNTDIAGSSTGQGTFLVFVVSSDGTSLFDVWSHDLS